MKSYGLVSRHIARRNEDGERDFDEAVGSDELARIVRVAQPVDCMTTSVVIAAHKALASKAMPWAISQGDSANCGTDDVAFSTNDSPQGPFIERFTPWCLLARTWASSQAGETLQRLYSQHEAREEIFALDLYLRKKAKKPGFVRAKIEGEFRAASRFGVGDERPDRMQVQDGGGIIAKTHEVPEGAHDYSEFVTRLTVGLGDAQLAGDSLSFADDFLLE